MIRIAITAAAFDAIAATLPLGSVAFEAAVDDRGLQSPIAVAASLYRSAAVRQ